MDIRQTINASLGYTKKKTFSYTGENILPFKIDRNGVNFQWISHGKYQQKMKNIRNLKFYYSFLQPRLSDYSYWTGKYDTITSLIIFYSVIENFENVYFICQT